MSKYNTKRAFDYRKNEVIATIRDLIMYLHHGNVTQAQPIVTNVAGYLNEIWISGGDPETPEMLRVQQTMFAIDEVRTRLAQRDFDGAGSAARDAAKEWKHKAAQRRCHLGLMRTRRGSFGTKRGFDRPRPRERANLVTGA